MANGYANSWWVDLDKICGQTTIQNHPQTPPWKGGGIFGKEGSVCARNADGSYDFEMVIEFWPQRLFYLGLGISGATLLGCLGYLGYGWVRRKKKLGSEEKK